MVKEAEDIEATLPNLPPAEREQAAMQAATLRGTSHDLMYGPAEARLAPAALAAMTRPDAAGNPAI